MRDQGPAGMLPDPAQLMSTAGSALQKKVIELLPKPVERRCALDVYDRFFGAVDGVLGCMAVPGRTQRPAVLTTLGLRQKFINIFIKYHVAWHFAGMPLVAPWKNLNFNDLACAFHAPIDSILIKELAKSPIGRVLRCLVRTDGRLQTLAGPQAWSRLNCRATYDLFQYLMRRIAWATWPVPPCPPQPRNNNDPRIKLIDGLSVEELRGVFNPGPQTRACESGDSRPGGDRMCIERKDDYFALKRDCASSRNTGALEKRPLSAPDGTLNAKAAFISSIAQMGGAFRALPGYAARRGATRRVGGSGYEGWAAFGSIPLAANYLGRYFSVCACDERTRRELQGYGVNVPLCR